MEKTQCGCRSSEMMGILCQLVGMAGPNIWKQDGHKIWSIASRGVTWPPVSWVSLCWLQIEGGFLSPGMGMESRGFCPPGIQTQHREKSSCSVPQCPGSPAGVMHMTRGHLNLYGAGVTWKVLHPAVWCLNEGLGTGDWKSYTGQLWVAWASL